MSARLHLLVGSGGVGKTTLAAGYALALAKSGRHVGLLGIDPAKRLQSALGLPLTDATVEVNPTLRAALLRPNECLRRWAKEACADDAARARLESNAFFLAMADRLAGATDILAAVRMAEWAERDPTLEDLVVDTAPGLNAVEFLRRPKSLATFLEGRLVSWLRWLSHTRTGKFGGLVRSGTAALGGLVRLGGTKMLFELADFLVLVEPVLAKMIERLSAAQAWLQRADTEVLLISAVRPEAVTTLAQFAGAMAEVGIQPAAIVLNRALPEGIGQELAAVELETLGEEDRAVVRFTLATERIQAALLRELREKYGRVMIVPAARGLDSEDRLRRLEALGEFGLPFPRPSPPRGEGES